MAESTTTVKSESSNSEINHGFSAIGRRKEAVARVWLRPKSGKDMNFMIRFPGNKRNKQRRLLSLEKYISIPSVSKSVYKPLEVCELENSFDILATVNGGGISGQAGALVLAIARAIEKHSPTSRGRLKKAGLLTRDPRAVERKKYGRHKARKGTQFSKR